MHNFGRKKATLCNLSDIQTMMPCPKWDTHLDDGCPINSACLQAVAAERPDTGISGVYEVMVGVSDAEPALTYFAEFGFTPVARAEFTATRALALYGKESIFLVHGPDGAYWQLIQRDSSDWPAVTEFQLLDVNN